MVSESYTEGVEMLHAFKRDHLSIGADRLVYPNLDSVSAEAKAKAPYLLDEFWNAPEGSVLEKDRARQAAIGYLVLTGAQLQVVIPERKTTVANRFTEAAIELYGRPETETATLLAARKLNHFRTYRNNTSVDQEKLELVINFYEQQLGGAEYYVSEEMDPELLGALTKLRNYLEQRFKDPLKVFDFNELKEPDTMIQPSKIVDLFDAALKVLANQDPAWKGWKIEVTKNSAMDSEARTKIIGVGRNPRKASTLKPLFGHEVLLHSLRAVNGSKTGDKMLELGLPESLDSEEGLAVFVEMALSGTTVARASDLYMFTAFALGALHMPARKRSELQSVYLDGLIVENQAQGQPKTDRELAEIAWGRINRVFRGSYDNTYTVINTKDIAYYNGFRDKACKYILQELKAGKSMAEVFEYIARGKFDPTNPRHRNYVDLVSK